jgi:hypothetical protein
MMKLFSLFLSGVIFRRKLNKVKLHSKVFPISFYGVLCKLVRKFLAQITGRENNYRKRKIFIFLSPAIIFLLTTAEKS